MANSDAFPPGTLEGLDIALGLPPGTLRFLIDTGMPVFDWLFGGGHVGSCGAFREQFEQVRSAIDPLLDISNAKWAQAGVNYNPTPTTIMNEAGPAIGAVLFTADDQFNVFRGSNLLGQTMFATRVLLHFERRWIASVLFGSAQWAQFQVGTLFEVMNNTTGRVFASEQAIAQIRTQLGTGTADHQALLNLQSQVNTIQFYTDDLRTRAVPNLERASAQYSQQLQAIYDVYLPGLWQTDANLNNWVFNYLVPNVQSILWDVQGLKNTALTTSSPAWQNVIQRVTQTETTIQQSLTPRLVQVERGLQTQADQINHQILPQLFDTTGRLNALYDFQNNWVIPFITIHGQQIADIQQDIIQRINPRLQGQANRIQQIRQESIPRLKQRLQVIEQDIPQVLEIPQIQDSLGRLQQRQTELEQQKINDILPHFDALDQGFLEIIRQIQQDLIPRDATQDQQITNLNNWVTNVAGPTFSTINNQITNLQTFITNIVSPNISLFITFINNITNEVTNIIQANCQLVYDCLSRARDNNPDNTCEEGRKYWGQWAECWLNENTPADPDTLSFGTEDLDPDQIVAFVGGYLDEDLASRGGQIYAHAVDYLGRALYPEQQTAVPQIVITDESTFVFVDV